MARVAQLLEYVQLLAFTLIALAATRRWIRHREPASGWFAVTFGLLITIIAAGMVLPEDPQGPLLDVVVKAFICILLLFPYCLYRFMASFEKPPRAVTAIAYLLVGTVIAATLLAPPFPRESEDAPTWVGLYVALILVEWVYLSLVVVVRLWRAGRGLPTVAKRRTQLLAAAPAVMAADLVLSVVSPNGTDSSPMHVIVNLVALVSALLFLFGFAPPQFLLDRWRRNDASAFQQNLIELVQATDPADVIGEMLPRIARLVGARGAELLGTDGKLLGQTGHTGLTQQATGKTRRELTIAEGVTQIGADELRVTLPAGRLDIWTSRYTPFFGREQLDLIQTLGALLQLTLERTLAHDRERHASQALAEASRHKSEFLANMSHEIRTPMNAVIGLTGLLLDSHLNPEQRDLLETVRSSGDALLCIINDILDFSKIESGELELEQQSFDLRDCVEGSLDLLTAAAAAKGLSLISHVDEDARWVSGDVTRLRQVLVNLLSNAVKFTSIGEVLVLVTTEKAGDKVQVSIAVTDSGIGIAADRQGQLFEPFKQVDASTTRIYGGTGLGLAISQRLVTAMGGELVVDSAVGLGSTFSFSLLLGAGVGPDGSAANEPMVSWPGMRALIVDDSSTSQRMLQLQLEESGLACTTAKTGQEARALIAAGGRYEVAFIDMAPAMMREQHLIADLRELQGAESLQIVLLRTMRTTLDHLVAAGAAAVLTKPVRNRALREALAKTLSPAGHRHATGRVGLPPQRTPAPVRLRVLLAEDNLVNQKVGRLMLTKLGHHVDTVGNGQEALEALRQLPYDVVLMDVQMPVMDGLEATRRIRAELPARRQPRIVALTANVLSEVREACADAGMDGYVAKPVRGDDLASALATAMVQPSGVPNAGLAATVGSA